MLLNQDLSLRFMRDRNTSNLFVCVSGPGPMEKSKEEYFPGLDQEGGGEENDGAVDDRGHLYLPKKEKHQNLPRDSGGQVG